MARDSTGELLTAALADLVGRVRDQRPAALADEPDAVHQLRTSVRRLRNLLAAFEKYVDADADARLRASLRTYGDLLGACRDLEVRAADCEGAIADLGLGPELREPLVGPLLAAHAAAHDHLCAWHRGPDLAALDTLLDLWAAAPPLSDRATRPAAGAAEKVVRRQVARVLEAAHRMDDADAEEAHDVRKAARRLRHAADAVTSGPGAVLSGWAEQVGRLAHDIQGMLGDHRDAVLLADHAREHASGVADPASYLRLVAHAEHRAGRAIGGLPQTLLALRDQRRP